MLNVSIRHVRMILGFLERSLDLIDVFFFCEDWYEYHVGC